MIRLINLAVFFSVGWATLLTAAGTIDYFDITKPKFQPLKVALQMRPANDLNGLYVQSVFQSNIEQTLFFSVFELTAADSDTKPESTAEKAPLDFVFRIELEVQQSEPLLISYRIYERKRNDPLVQGKLTQEAGQELRTLGILFSDIFIKTSLGFDGISKSRIAYTSQKKNGRKNIVLSSYDGTRQQRFSYNLGSNNYASWSFDNRHLLYTTFTRSGVQLAIQPAKRLRASILSFPDGTQPQGGTWSPVHRSILITLMKKGNSDIFSYNRETRGLEKIIAWKSLETSPVWSPDGNSVVFVSDSARAQQPQIYMHGLKTRKTQRLTFRGKYNSSPRWSPDGTQIVYESKRKGYFQIFKYTLTTNRHQQLTYGRFNSEKPDWSPNGKQIVFSSNRDGKPKLFLTSVYGGRMIRLTTNPGSTTEANPVWSK